MTQPQDHDHARRQPRLRIGPWLPDPDSDTMPPTRLASSATPARPALSTPPNLSDHQPSASPSEPMVVPIDPTPHPTDRRSHRLILAGVGTAVLGLLLTALWPTTPPPPVAEPPTPPGRFGWPHAPDLPWPPPGTLTPSAPQASSSVGGVSSTRPIAPSQVSSPTRSPSSAAATRTSPAATRTTSPAAPSASPSRTVRPTPSPRPAEPRELTPLPPWRERDLRSVSGGQETSIEFVNHRSRSVIVYWLDHHGHRRQYAALEPSESYRQHTYVGHPWVVTDRRGRSLACFEPTANPARAVIR